MHATQDVRVLRLLPLSVVEHRTGYRKSKLYELLAANTFPRPVRDGRNVRFVEHEVEHWIRERIRERDAACEQDKPRLLNEREKAAELGLSVSTLQKDRRREQPRYPFVRVGPHVRYAPELQS
jgi:prophage regulatory protein